ncbi:MAG TPA: DUF4974 domain-containing protein, partial [Chitinophagaceae bacterium]|jgi:hypothetical protein|nr:DUF4974 domain-containing protein [Chitinophagaceae bacterium]
MYKPAYRLLLCSLLLILGTADGWTQTGQKVSGSFSGQPFRQFVQTLEGSSPYRFYYDEQELDTLPVTAAFRDEPLAAVLKNLLPSLGLHFYIDASDRVYISRQPLQPGLAADYFVRRSGPADTARALPDVAE